MRLDRKPELINYRDRQLSATGINDVIRSMPRQFVGGPGLDIEQLGDRYRISRVGAPDLFLPDVVNYLDRFVVVAEREDYLICTPFYQPADGSSGLWIPQEHDAGLGSATANYGTIYVAKPRPLQKSPWNGATVLLNGFPTTYTYTGVNTRLATRSSESSGASSEVITPSYFPGDIILATRSVTGVLAEEEMGSATSSGSLHGNPLVIWEDLNFACRVFKANGDVGSGCIIDYVTKTEPCYDEVGNVVAVRSLHIVRDLRSATCGIIRSYWEPAECPPIGTATSTITGTGTTHTCWSYFGCYSVSPYFIEGAEFAPGVPVPLYLFNQVWKLRYDPLSSDATTHYFKQTLIGSTPGESGTIILAMRVPFDDTTLSIVYTTVSNTYAVVYPFNSTFSLCGFSFGAVPDPCDTGTTVWMPPDNWPATITATTIECEIPDCQDIDNGPWCIDLNLIGEWAVLNGPRTIPYLAITPDGATASVTLSRTGYPNCCYHVFLTLTKPPCYSFLITYKLVSGLGGPCPEMSDANFFTLINPVIEAPAIASAGAIEPIVVYRCVDTGTGTGTGSIPPPIPCPSDKQFCLVLSGLSLCDGVNDPNGSYLLQYTAPGYFASTVSLPSGPYFVTLNTNLRKPTVFISTVAFGETSLFEAVTWSCDSGGTFTRIGGNSSCYGATVIVTGGVCVDGICSCDYAGTLDITSTGGPFGTDGTWVATLSATCVWTVNTGGFFDYLFTVFKDGSLWVVEMTKDGNMSRWESSDGCESWTLVIDDFTGGSISVARTAPP